MVHEHLEHHSNTRGRCKSVNEHGIPDLRIDFVDLLDRVLYFARVYRLPYFHPLRDRLEVWRGMHVGFCGKSLGGEWGAVADEVVHDEMFEVSARGHLEVSSLPFQTAIPEAR